MRAVPINDDIGFLPLCSPPVYYAEMLIVAHRVAPFLAVRKYYSKGVLSLSHYFFALLHSHCKFKTQKSAKATCPGAWLLR